jgi:hypothetical protein
MRTNSTTARKTIWTIFKNKKNNNYIRCAHAQNVSKQSILYFIYAKRR